MRLDFVIQALCGRLAFCEAVMRGSSTEGILGAD